MCVEWCCDEFSRLSTWFEANGHHVLRVCLPQLDAEQQSTLQFAKQEVEKWLEANENHCVLFWSAVPCTVWSTWQYINESLHNDEPRLHQLYAEREKSKKLIRKFCALHEHFKAEARCFTVFEWPAYCQGWKQQVMKNLLHELPLDILFHGCATD